MSTASVLSHRTSLDAGRLREVSSLSHLLSFLTPDVLCLHPKVAPSQSLFVCMFLRLLRVRSNNVVCFSFMIYLKGEVQMMEVASALEGG